MKYSALVHTNSCRIFQNINSITIYLCVVGGDGPVKTHFQLDKLGNLSLTTKFDRENLENPKINMIIKATPKCLQTPEPVEYPPPNYGSDRSLLWVEVGNMIINATPKCLQTPEAVEYPPPNYGSDSSLLWVEVGYMIIKPEAVAYTPPNYGSDRSLLWVEVGYMIIKPTPKCLQTPEAVGYPPSNYGLDRSLLWLDVGNHLLYWSS